MHLFSNQILWDFPRFWGFCALNLFNISIDNSVYIYTPVCVYWHNNYKASPFMNHLYLASLWSQHQNHQVRNIRSKLLSPPKNIGFYRRVFSNRGSQVLCKFAPRSRSERKAMKRPPLNSPNWTCARYNGARSLSARIGHQFFFHLLFPQFHRGSNSDPSCHKLEWIMSQAQLCWYHRLTRTSTFLVPPFEWSLPRWIFRSCGIRRQQNTSIPESSCPNRVDGHFTANDSRKSWAYPIDGVGLQFQSTVRILQWYCPWKTDCKRNIMSTKRLPCNDNQHHSPFA